MATAVRHCSEANWINPGATLAPEVALHNPIRGIRGQNPKYREWSLCRLHGAYSTLLPRAASLPLACTKAVIRPWRLLPMHPGAALSSSGELRSPLHRTFPTGLDYLEIIGMAYDCNEIPAGLAPRISHSIDPA